MSTKLFQGKNKRLLIIGGLLIAGGGILAYKFLQKRKLNQIKSKFDAVPESAATQPVKAPTPSLFPLKNGSPKNDLVKQLQGYLGVAADGVFGPKTESALKSKTGKTQIATQTEFNTVIAQLKLQNSSSVNFARAQDIVTRWTANTDLQLTTLRTTFCIGVVKDAYGALITNDKDIYLGAGRLNRKDYTPILGSDRGFLVFSINNGDRKGIYKADPNNFTLS